MGYIVKQPNGLYCRFSTMCDDITHYNMTEKDYINYCVKRAKEEAIREAKDVLQNHLQPFERIIEDFIPNCKEEVEVFEKQLKAMGGIGFTDEQRKEKLEMCQETPF